MSRAAKVLKLLEFYDPNANNPSNWPNRPSPSEMFISPNVSDLNFSQAHDRVKHSLNQQALNTVSERINRKLGLTETYRANVLGAWADGAENSLMTSLKGDHQLVRAAAAIHGAVTNQKSVLVFQPKEDENEHMATFDMDGDLHDIHQQLLHEGLQYHTLEPRRTGGAKVHIYAQDQPTIDAISRVAGHKPVNFVTGKGEFIGTEVKDNDPRSDAQQRADAQREYRKVIRQADHSGALEDRNAGAIWRSADHRWRQAMGREETVAAVRHNPAIVLHLCWHIGVRRERLERLPPSTMPRLMTREIASLRHRSPQVRRVSKIHD